MEAKKQRNKWFTWHLLPAPKDYPIQSVLEFAVLIISLVVLLFVYGTVNHVNVIDEELNIAYLDRLRYSPNHSFDKDDLPYRYKKATVDLYLPMTVQEQLKRPHNNVDVCIKGTSKESYSYLLDNYSATRSEVMTYDSMIVNEYPLASDSLTKYSYYYCQKLRIRDWLTKRNLELFSSNYPKDEHCKDGLYYGIEKIYNDSSYAYSSLFVTGEYQRTKSIWHYRNTGSFFGKQTGVNPLLGNPGWFALEDVSQTYFKLKLRTFDIDSLALKIDFVGATEFLEMQPKPDETGMSYVKFTNLAKIRQIQENGLLFHAQFRELENRQSVRIFFLTALLSVNVISLIVFMFFASYKMINAWREKRVKLKAKTKKRGQQ